MKISKSEFDYIHNDLYLIDYLVKILKNQYYYYRNIDEVKAHKFISTCSNLEYCRKEIYRKRANDVRNRHEALENEYINTQLSMNI